MPVVGLQTHIWNNNFKSIVLLLLFPVILTVIIYCAVVSILAIGGAIEPTYETRTEYVERNQFPYCLNGIRTVEKEYPSYYNRTNPTVSRPRTYTAYECAPLPVSSSTYYTNQKEQVTRRVAVKPNIDAYFNQGLKSMVEYAPIILAFVLIWFFIAWIFHRNIINSLTGAKSVTRKDFPELYNIVENLAISRGLPTPAISIIDDESMNAFATGLSPKRASIAFSKGILKNLTKEEIEAVAAHELTHIINRDTKLMMIAIIFAGIIQTIAWAIIRVRFRARGKKAGQALLVLLIMKVIAFFIGILFTLAVQAAVSKRREYLADAGAVELTKTSKHLISALKKIDSDPYIEAIGNRNVAQICIDNPLSDSKSTGFFDKLFSTHPQMKDRIKALELIG